MKTITFKNGEQVVGWLKIIPEKANVRADGAGEFFKDFAIEPGSNTTPEGDIQEYRAASIRFWDSNKHFIEEMLVELGLTMTEGK